MIVHTAFALDRTHPNPALSYASLDCKRDSLLEQGARHVFAHPQLHANDVYAFLQTKGFSLPYITSYSPKSNWTVDVVKKERTDASPTPLRWRCGIYKQGPQTAIVTAPERGALSAQVRQNKLTIDGVWFSNLQDPFVFVRTADRVIKQYPLNISQPGHGSVEVSLSAPLQEIELHAQDASGIYQTLVRKLFAGQTKWSETDVARWHAQIRRDNQAHDLGQAKDALNQAASALLAQKLNHPIGKPPSRSEIFALLKEQNMGASDAFAVIIRAPSLQQAFSWLDQSLWDYQRITSDRETDWGYAVAKNNRGIVFVFLTVQKLRPYQQLSEAQVVKGLACRQDGILDNAARYALTNTRLGGLEVAEYARNLGTDTYNNFMVRRFSRATTLDEIRDWLKPFDKIPAVEVVCAARANADQLVVIAAPRRGTLKIMKRGQALDIEAAWHRRYKHISLYFETLHKSLLRSRLEDAKGQKGRLVFRPDEPIASVQLVGSGPFGGEILAKQLLLIVKPNHEHEHDPGAWVARLRADVGLSDPLKHNNVLDLISQEHADNMCKRNMLAHNLGDGGVQVRASRHGVFAASFGEVIASNRTLAGALKGLEESPAHRAGVTYPKNTDWGVGIGQCDGWITLAISFAEHPYRDEPLK